MYATRKQYQTSIRYTSQGTEYKSPSRMVQVDYSNPVSAATIIINTLAVVITLAMVAGLVMLVVE